MCCIGPLDLRAGDTTFERILTFGKQPIAMFFFMVNANVFTEFSRCVYKFESFKLTSAVAIYGADTYPKNGFKAIFAPNHASNQYDVTEAYVNFIRALGVFGSNSGCISLDDWKGDNVVFGIEFARNYVGGVYKTPTVTSEYLRLNLTFEDPLEEAVKLFCLPIYESSLRISPDSVVSVDYISSLAG